ncbi:hypothetical protein ACJW31_07G136700 [Castanea mollissima]
MMCGGEESISKSFTNPISSVDPSEFTKTTEATMLFFPGKGNLNTQARSARLRLTQTDLISHRLLGFDHGMGFVGLQFKGLGFVRLGIMRLWVLLILILIFEWSCCLALETERGVLVRNGWES